MNATELRIDNLVYDGHECSTISSKGIQDIIEDNHPGGITYSPIPLTEAWLQDFGFEKSSGIFSGGHYENDAFGISVKNRYCNIGDEGGNVIEVRYPEYVHQLQNLYHALTGEELTAK